MPPDDPRENLCLKCGRCCVAKVILEDVVYYTDIPCPHLDLRTHLCTIYTRRFQLNPECLTVDQGIRLGVFPSDCPYVRDIPSYRPPHTDCDLKKMGRLYLADDE